MAEQVALDGEKVAYPPLQFLTDLRAGVWSELATPGTSIDIYRRNVQRAYLDNMDARLNAGTGSSEVRALVRGELQALDKQLQSAQPGASPTRSRGGTFRTAGIRLPSRSIGSCRVRRRPPAAGSAADAEDCASRPCADAGRS